MENYTLTVRNFQRFSSLNLPLRKGFTCIVGTSNTGKSSILRAIFSVLRNDFAPSYISVGEKESKVTVKCSEGRIGYVSLTKGMSGKTLSVNQYEVAPLSVHPKVGKAPLSDFLPQCTDGRPQIFYNADPVTIQPSPTAPQTVVDFNYQSQFQGMFLFSMSPSQMSVIFNYLFGASRYQTALRLVNKDTTALNSESERLADERRICSDTLMTDESELSDIRMKLNVTDGYIESLNSLGSRIESADKVEQSFNDVITRKTSAYVGLGRARILSESVQKIREICQSAQRIKTSIERLLRYTAIREGAGHAISLCRSLRDTAYKLSYYAGGIVSISESCQRYGEVSDSLGKYRHNVSILKGTNMSEVSGVLSKALSVIRNIHSYQSVSNRTSAIRASIEKLKEMSVGGLSDDILRVMEIKRTVGRVGMNQKYRDMIQKKIGDIKILRDSLNSYRESLMESGGYVCPLCGERKKCRC